MYKLYKCTSQNREPKSIVDGPRDSALWMTRVSYRGKLGFHLLEHDHHLQLLPYTRGICSSRYSIKNALNIILSKESKYVYLYMLT